VSATTRERVRRVIHEQNYSPNAAARSLVIRRSQTVGMVLPTMNNSISSPYYMMVMQGVTTVCDQRGYNLMLLPASTITPDGYGPLVNNGAVDGFIVSTSSVGRPFLEWLHNVDFPFVLIGRQPDLPMINMVASDYEQGAAMATQHLIWLGYTHIAMITGPREHGSAIGRRDGFMRALHDAGIACPPGYLVEGNFTLQSGQQAMAQLLSVCPRPEAVFCASDEMAIGAMRVARDAGLRIPEDIAFVGFDDISVAKTTEPPLTTVRQPVEQLGFTATTMLIDILEAHTLNPPRKLEPQHVVLPTELVVRSSCGQQQRFRVQTPLAEHIVRDNARSARG
jgi:LacI family transcriptional regulator